jgi:hypothetical protein
MVRKRGNPNWSKPDMQAAPVVPTSFEDVVKKLRLSPQIMKAPSNSRSGCERIKTRKYIPDDLLKLWGFEVKGDL